MTTTVLNQFDWGIIAKITVYFGFSTEKQNTSQGHLFFFFFLHESSKNRKKKTPRFTFFKGFEFYSNYVQIPVGNVMEMAMHSVLDQH